MRPGSLERFAMTKLSNGVHPIKVGEALYQFTSRSLCLQFHDFFATHFSPHQFGVATKSGYELVIHGIKCTMDLHLTGFFFNWT
jgi:hypothetical protein